MPGVRFNSNLTQSCSRKRSVSDFNGRVNWSWSETSPSTSTRATLSRSIGYWRQRGNPMRRHPKRFRRRTAACWF